MRRSLSVVAAVALGLAGGMGGYWLYHFTRPAPVDAPPSESAASVLGQPRPGFALNDLAGQRQDVAQWDQHVVLLNFWATWCPPCRREIPALIELQERYRDRGLRVVGVAIDQRQLVEEYGDTMGVNYPLLVGETDALAVSADYGNRYGQLPYSVFIDRDGTIRHVQRGELTLEEAERVLAPLL